MDPDPSESRDGHGLGGRRELRTENPGTVADSEAGLGIEPEIAFVACFGGPLTVHHPYVYAGPLKKKMLQHGARRRVVNAGWIGGPFGIGKRISIRHTRAFLSAALVGKFEDVPDCSDFP